MFANLPSLESFICLWISGVPSPSSLKCRLELIVNSCMSSSQYVGKIDCLDSECSSDGASVKVEGYLSLASVKIDCPF